MTDQAGWPCAALLAYPPSVLDAQANPSADDLLPQVLALTPRGAAWGTDGLTDPRAPSVMRGFWRAVASWAAANNAAEFEAATQVFPSAVTYALVDWETELGLPDTCLPGDLTTAGRISAVRARYATLGGSSPAYFVCLAASVGYRIEVEESTQFECDASQCGGDDPVADFDLIPFWTVNIGDVPTDYFCCDDGQCDLDPLESFTPAYALECVLRRAAPKHTGLVFSYTPLTTIDLTYLTIDSTLVRIDAV